MEAQSQLTFSNSDVMTSQSLLVHDSYTDKSFVVYGNTRPYKDILLSMHGKFIKRLKFDNNLSGFCFSNKQKENVMEFVSKVNSGENVSLLPSEEPSNDLPTVYMPSNSSTYQFVKFKIYKPREGQTVELRTEGKGSMKGKVIQTETHDDVLDTVYIDFNGQTSKAVICNKSWSIHGYQLKHSLFFTDK